MSFFRTFQLLMEITSQLRWVQVCQLTVSFSTSELCYKCFSYKGIFFMTLGLRFLQYVCITYGNNVTITFCFVRHCDVCFITSQLRYLFIRCTDVFFMTLELRYFLVRQNYVRKLRYKMLILVTFFCNQKMISHYLSIHLQAFVLILYIYIYIYTHIYTHIYIYNIYNI